METSAEIRVKDKVPERIDTYERWQAAQKIPVVR